MKVRYNKEDNTITALGVTSGLRLAEDVRTLLGELDQARVDTQDLEIHLNTDQVLGTISYDIEREPHAQQTLHNLPIVVTDGHLIRISDSVKSDKLCDVLDDVITQIFEHEGRSRPIVGLTQSQYDKLFLDYYKVDEDCNIGDVCCINPTPIGAIAGAPVMIVEVES